MTDVVALEPRLDTAAAGTLQATLSSALGKDVSFDVSGVEHLGGRCLELLLRFRNGTQMNGHALTLMSPSEALLRDLKTFGLTPDDISTGGTT